LVPAGLAEAELEILGLLPASSNYTFLSRLGDDEGTLVVYKPRKGETPLWDFPSGTLCRRETAAYLVSEAAGWGQVPPTVLRDGPLGLGMVQQFIEHDPAHHAFNLAPEHEPELKRIALFDLVVNNADRKAGHVLRDAGGRLWAVDHGLCFHTEPKLRTVLWDYVGDPIPADGLEAVARLCAGLPGELGDRLSDLLLPEEIAALGRRAELVLQSKVFPEPGPGRPYPWPPI
jgi:uncharacterized repeat protein (TIGR03843 family)